MTKVNKAQFIKEAFRADAKVGFSGVFLGVNKPKTGSLMNCALFLFVPPESRCFCFIPAAIFGVVVDFYTF